jgi:hypothetical protein
VVPHCVCFRPAPPISTGRVPNLLGLPVTPLKRGGFDHSPLLVALLLMIP